MDTVLRQNIKRRGMMIVLSSPSGAGKTTLAKCILSLDKNIINSISCTTRPRREGEIDKVDYYFVNKENFNKMMRNDEFLEYAKVFDNFYGTPKAPVSEALENGKDIIFDIDWQGTQKLAQFARADLVSIFVLPPSLKELHHRLQSRAQDATEVIEKRMREATNEMSHWAEYDYVIINYSLEESINQLHSIIIAERLKRTRQVGIGSFIDTLREID